MSNWPGKHRMIMRHTKKRNSISATWFTLAIVSLLFTCACSVAKSNDLYLDLQEKRTIHFAGVSLLGSAAYIGENYPVAKKLNSFSADKPIARLDNTFYKLAQPSNSSNIELSFDFANLTNSSATMLTLAINHESVSHMETELGRIKSTAEVSGQLLVFDFHSMTLAANYPVYIQKNHISSSLADARKSEEVLIRDLYLADSESGGETLLTLATKQIEKVILEEKAGRYIQVDNIEISQGVAARLPAGRSETSFRQFLGQQFTGLLSNNYQLEVLPFVKGYSIGNKMAGRFSDGKAYNLSLPAPDYTLSVAITGLESREYDNNYMLYASQVRFTLTDKLSSEKLIECTFHYAVPAYRKPDSGLNDWAAYVDSIEELMSETSSMFGNPDLKWIRGHGGDKSDFKQLRKNKWLFTAN